MPRATALGWRREETSMTSEFIVDGWSARDSEVSFHYRGGGHSFTEVVLLPLHIDKSPVVSRLLDLLAVIAGASYAKALAPAHITFPALDISPEGLNLIRLTYNEGMREFAYQNKLSLTSTFEIGDVARGGNFQIEALRSEPGSPLIPFGAGRDSCVVASALKHLRPTLFTIGSNPFAQNVAHALSLPLLVASRSIDPALLQLNQTGAPNGHIPVTAINSLISLVVAEHTGHTSVVMANEKSSSQPTRVVNGIEINHQFSKSLTYERALQRATDIAGSIVNYTSVLRHVPDHDISFAFATKCTELHHFFMSCNQAMLRDDTRRSNGWCCQCPKCRGMFLSLAPFLTPHEMRDIFGHDLLDDETQVSGFRDLMSNDTKPFECVADVNESRRSMRQLLEQSQWSQHSVVQACRDIAIVDNFPEQDSDDSAGEFDLDIQRFVKSSQ